MLIPIIFTGVSGYYIYDKLIAERLDSPKNNENIKGLEKAEIKGAIKEGEKAKKDLEAEIKQLEKERKEENDADKKQEKLEAKNERLEVLKELEKNLTDLKTVDKGNWAANAPNKLTWNNGLWIVGFILALFFIYKISLQIFKSLFRSIGFEEGNN